MVATIRSIATRDGRLRPHVHSWRREPRGRTPSPSPAREILRKRLEDMGLRQIGRAMCHLYGTSYRTGLAVAARRSGPRFCHRAGRE